MAWTEQTDVVVVGAGIGGLVTGIETLEADPSLDVTILEKGTRAGGTSVQSGGAFYCFETVEQLHERDPPGNRVLQEIVVERHREGWDWLEEHGVPLRHVDIAQNDFEGVLPECLPMIKRKPVARRVDTHEMIDALVDSFEDLGGDLQYRTAMQGLRSDGDGAVTGVVAENEEGRFVLEAAAVVLATGGYPANERLVEENFYTENSDDLWLRACKWCTGDGIAAAEDVGGKTSQGMNDFYGKTMITPPDAEFTPYEYPEATAYYGPFSLALNRRGERFADESVSIHEKSVIKAAAREGYGRVYYVLDETLVDSVIQPTKEQTVREMLETQREMGGRIADVDSFDQLAETLSSWGVDGERAVATITEYNEAIRMGRAEKLDPPRGENKLTFDTPPFYVVEVQPSITLTLGGLDVTTDMQVLNHTRSGSTFAHAAVDEDPQLTEPIGGLYAVGADVGNVGAITLIEDMSPMTANTVFGLIAAQEVADSAAPG
jgi:fumarate reductase flavoprotein subunit